MPRINKDPYDNRKTWLNQTHGIVLAVLDAVKQNGGDLAPLRDPSWVHEITWRAAEHVQAFKKDEDGEQVKKLLKEG